MRLWREGYPDGVIVNPGATLQLQHYDRVDIVSGLPLTYVRYPLSVTRKSIDSNSTAMAKDMLLRNTWESQNPIPIDGCAALGSPNLLRVYGLLTPSRIGIYVVRT